VIRHIVTWKLKAEDEAEKAEASFVIREGLKSLVPLLPGLVALEVSRNVAYAEQNFDLVLVADYASLADLEAYQVHPRHVEVAGLIRERVSARASIDFEVAG
jgi:hypothetical protein